MATLFSVGLAVGVTIAVGLLLYYQVSKVLDIFNWLIYLHQYLYTIVQQEILLRHIHRYQLSRFWLETYAFLLRLLLSRSLVLKSPAFHVH